MSVADGRGCCPESYTNWLIVSLSIGFRDVAIILLSKLVEAQVEFHLLVVENVVLKVLLHFISQLINEL